MHSLSFKQQQQKEGICQKCDKFLSLFMCIHCVWNYSYVEYIFIMLHMRIITKELLDRQAFDLFKFN